MDYHRRSIRLKGYDYSQDWFYFVTICAQNRGNVFGEIVGARRDSPLIINNKSSLIDKNNNPLRTNKNNILVNKINNNKLKINNNIFGNELNNNLPKIKLNQNGKIIDEIWKTLPDHNNVILDEFIIMPDHVHFILVIKNNNYQLNTIKGELENDNVIKNGNDDVIININNGELENDAKGDLKNTIKGESRLAPTLGFVIGMFKTESTKRINKLNETPRIQLWQRNYYERIIRNEKEYLMIKKYIKDNPIN